VLASELARRLEPPFLSVQAYDQSDGSTWEFSVPIQWRVPNTVDLITWWCQSGLERVVLLCCTTVVLLFPRFRSTL
jgi:hypothetical protein